MKSPLLKVIDFDSVVKNTKVAKSIILIKGFSNFIVYSRSFEITNMEELSPRGLTVAGLNQIKAFNTYSLISQLLLHSCNRKQKI